MSNSPIVGLSPAVRDNAAMESFFSSLKTERTERKIYRTRNEARVIARDLFDGKTLARVFSLTMIATVAAPGFSPIAGSALDGLFGWRSSIDSKSGHGTVVIDVVA